MLHRVLNRGLRSSSSSTRFLLSGRNYCVKSSIGSIKSGQLGETLTLSGWVRSVRKHKSICFVNFNDGSNLEGLQITCSAEMAKILTVGCSIEVVGELRRSPQKNVESSLKKMEIQADTLRLLGECDSKTYPLQKKGHSLEFLREIMHFRARSNTFGAVMRIRNGLSHSIHNYFQSEGFLHVHTPIITSNDAEGGGEQFRISTDEKKEEFFGKPAYLTVSGQLHGEMYACALSKIYTFGPTFRAENSNTSRHLAEFWMIEPEVAFADLKDNIDLAENTIKAAVNGLLEKNMEDVEFCNKFIDPNVKNRLETTISQEFIQMTYTEAIEILLKSKIDFTHVVQWGNDLKSEHERYLAEVYCQRPVFITDYPVGLKPFYMKLNDDGKTVKCMDLLVPGIGELIGGSVREDDFDKLKLRMMQDGLLQKEDNPLMAGNLEWYLDLRKFGSVPHAGWGLGFERLVQYVTGLENIKDAIPVPRYPKSCKY